MAKTYLIVLNAEASYGCSDWKVDVCEHADVRYMLPHMLASITF